MGFRIRTICMNRMELKEYEAKEKLYREHLEKLSANKDRDLWKYFCWDTFHDGYIEKVSFWDTPGNITFHMSCPNIKKKNGDAFNYICPTVMFECHFRNVVFFSYEHNQFNDLRCEQYCPSFQYLSSEIDTLTEIINKYNSVDEDGDDLDIYHSLIMNILAGDTSFYMEMVFSQVDVYPKEPIAFEMMLKSNDFHVPVYEGTDFENLPKWISKPSGTRLDNLSENND